METKTPRASRERELFLQALEITDAREVERFLERECRGDARLARRVKELLGEQASIDDFLESPAVALSTTPAGSGHATRRSPSGSPQEQPGDRIGPYKLLQKLGEGGCGVVYMAEQESPVRRRVALKIIKLGMDTRQVIARFEAERQALALMDHPNIARVLDAGATATGRPFFVMELVRGVKITEYCDQNRVPTEERLKLFIQVCNAIQHAHQKSIVHRDIKPSNILVTLHDGVPVPKVIDFGVAKATNQQLLTDKTVFTAFEQFIGTPAYMSPEQAEMSGLDVDTRSDIYSLGVLLYELLTGRPPFDPETLARGTLDECRRTIRVEEPVRPSNRLATMLQADLATVARQRGTESPRLVHLLKGDLDWIVMKCLEKDRTRRYATANALAADVQRQLNGELVEARPPSTWYRLQKFSQRNKGPLVAGLALGLVLVGGIIASTWQALRARDAEKAALAAQKDEAFQRRAAETGWQRYKEKSEVARLNQYVADINLAHQALQAGNYGRASQLLKRQAPQAGEADLRGFEWRYLWGLCQGDQHYSLPTQDGAVFGLSFSPGGEWLAVLTWNAVVILDIRTRLTLARLPGRMASAEFSTDGKYLFTTAPGFGPREGGRGNAPETRVWTTADWKEQRVLPESSAPLLLSRDGKRLAGDGPESVRVWDTSTWAPLDVPKPPQSSLVAFSGDGDRLVLDEGEEGLSIRSVDGSARPVRLENSTNLFRWGGPFRIRNRLAGFTADGKRFVAARNERSRGADGTAVREPFGLSVWDAATGRELTSLPADGSRIEHAARISELAISSDGKRLATASMDHSLRIWDLEDPRVVTPLHGHLSEVWAVAFSPDGQSVASGGKDGAVKIWSTRRVNPDNILEGLSVPVAFSRNSGTLVALNNDRPSALVAIDMATREQQQTIPLEEREGFGRRFRPAVAWDAGLLAEGLDQGRVKLTDFRRNQTEILQVGGGRRSGPAALSPDGTRLVAGQPLQLWELPGLQPTPLDSSAYLAVFSPHGDSLAVFSRSNVIQIVNAASKATRTTIQLETNPGFAHAFSPDGRLLATTSSPEEPEQDVLLWDTLTGKRVGLCSGHKQAIFSIAFAPDGKTLASAADDRTIKLWNVATSQELVSISRPGEGPRGLLFSPDGKRLLASWGGADQEAGIEMFLAPPPEEANGAGVVTP